MSRPVRAPAPEGGPGAGLPALVDAIRACRICRDAPATARPLPHEPRPVLQIGAGAAQVVICGQAPGTRVHATGRPFTDPSGDRLREWLGIGEKAFYDPARVAIVPMGFCFPGQDSRGGDLPPRPECARTWHGRLFALMPPPRLTVLLGLAAARWHLRRLGRPGLAAAGLDAAVSAWDGLLAQGVVALPHPSWRTRAWTARRPWFETELLPALRARVAEAILAADPRTEARR
jgi:uracil-DNA glycosylase